LRKDTIDLSCERRVGRGLLLGTRGRWQQRQLGNS
jgi:hypothetical protein